METESIIIFENGKDTKEIAETNTCCKTSQAPQRTEPDPE